MQNTHCTIDDTPNMVSVRRKGARMLVFASTDASDRCWMITQWERGTQLFFAGICFKSFKGGEWSDPDRLFVFSMNMNKGLEYMGSNHETSCFHCPAEGNFLVRNWETLEWIYLVTDTKQSIVDAVYWLRLAQINYLCDGNLKSWLEFVWNAAKYVLSTSLLFAKFWLASCSRTLSFFR